KFAKQFNGTKFVIKAGFMDGKVLPLADVIALADLPSKDVLVAQVLGTMLAPITALAIVLKAIAEKNGSAAPVAEVAAPAAEVAAPAEEVAAPVEEVAAPVAEVAAPAEETPAE
ncbi:MAG: 50S ribosomal protein L10, partial [Oscillospiraceae bacterium]